MGILNPFQWCSRQTLSVIRLSRQDRSHLESILVFCYCETSYFIFGVLQKHIFIVSQFPWVRSLCLAYLGPLLRVPQSCNQGVGWAVLFPGAQVSFQARAVVGQIHFFAVVGLRSSFLCWLLGGDHSQV